MYENVKARIRCDRGAEFTDYMYPRCKTGACV